MHLMSFELQDDTLYDGNANETMLSFFIIIMDRLSLLSNPK